MSINRNVLKSKNGYSLVEVSNTDSEGHVMSKSYEIVGPGEFIKSFSSLEEALRSYSVFQYTEEQEQEQKNKPKFRGPRR